MQDDPIPQTDWTLVQRYLIGPVTPAETDAARSVIQREPRLRALVDVLRTTAPVTDNPFVDVSSLKQRIDATRLVTSSFAVRPRRFKGQPLRQGMWYTLAGVLAGMIAIVAGQHVHSRHLFDGYRASPLSTYVTGNGERATITLPDGSTVALNVASRLEVPADYLAGNHTLRLSGEALFTVQHRDETPFSVIAGSTTTRVLGTSFLVRHYATDSNTTVAVRDGKVAVHSAVHSPVVLTGARQIQLNQAGSGGVQVADLSQFSFATGVLTLKSMPFREAIAELDRWYDADIRLGDPVLNVRRVTGENAAGSLADLTEILEVTFNVRVVRNGRVLTLYPR